MNTRQHDLIAFSHDGVRRPEIRAILDSHVVTRRYSGLGGSHTVVTYPPLDALEPVTWGDLSSRLTPVRGIHWYAHIAFCEHLCPFCHYAKTYSPVDRESELACIYLDALCEEIASWSMRLPGSSLASVYIGGGTPTSIQLHRLERILSLLLGLPREPGFVACVETSPLAMLAPGGREKHAALIATGVGRLSMGMQTFDDQLLRRTRGHGAREANDATERLTACCANVNIDLIQDLPHQSDDAILVDLEAIATFRPQQVTWYLLRLQSQSVWHHAFTKGRLNLPPPDESVRRRILIREGMRRLGYTPHPGGRFVLDPSSRDRYKEARMETTATLLGTGIAAYSHGWGQFFRNTHGTPIAASIQRYAERIRREGCAVEEGLQVDATELLAAQLVAGIRSGVHLPEPTAGTRVYWLKAREILTRLARLDLLAMDTTGAWRLTECGFLFEEEVCSLFYSAAVKNLLSESVTA